MDHLGRRARLPGSSVPPLANSLPVENGTKAETGEEWFVRIHVDELGATARIREAIRQGLTQASRRLRGVVVVCVGTDRSTGDALGPLTGHRLKTLAPGHVPIFGTLEEPVHAGNLADRMADVARRFPGHAVVAVDACLGSLENVGTICIGQGALRPGAGVNKVLPPVGDLHVTGVVNVGGFMEYFVLQNTRLHLVMKMAAVIAEGLAGLYTPPGLHRLTPELPARL